MIIICMRVFLKQITPFSDQHLSQPKFFAILINKDLGILQIIHRGNKYFGNGLVLLDDVQIEPEMVDTNVLYSVLRGKMTSSKNN